MSVFIITVTTVDMHLNAGFSSAEKSVFREDVRCSVFAACELLECVTGQVWSECVDQILIPTIAHLFHVVYLSFIRQVLSLVV